MKEKVLKMRMYFFVIYQFANTIHASIQAGHAALRYVRKYANDNPEVWDFIDNHETWIILNGGTSNSDLDENETPIGTLNQIGDELVKNDIQIAWFHEQDLNNALTAICFLADERVFNKTDYPDFVDYILDVKLYSNAKTFADPKNWVMLKTKTNEELQIMFPEYYKDWIRFVGGIKNVFLRNLLKGNNLL